MDLEAHGITISNKKSLDSDEELPDNIVLVINKHGENRYRIDTESGYYIPSRIFYVGEEEELFEGEPDKKGVHRFSHLKLVQSVADDVCTLARFFHKPKLRVLVTAQIITSINPYETRIESIPKDWYYTIQTLEDDINREIEKMIKENLVD